MELLAMGAFPDHVCSADELKAKRAVNYRWEPFNNDNKFLLVLTNSVPAVAATQRGRALFCVNRRKGCVGGYSNCVVEILEFVFRRCRSTV